MGMMKRLLEDMVEDFYKHLVFQKEVCERKHEWLVVPPPLDQYVPMFPPNVKFKEGYGMLWARIDKYPPVR